jgi:hypothetical protein
LKNMIQRCLLSIIFLVQSTLGSYAFAGKDASTLYDCISDQGGDKDYLDCYNDSECKTKLQQHYDSLPSKDRCIKFTNDTEFKAQIKSRSEAGIGQCGPECQERRRRAAAARQPTETIREVRDTIDTQYRPSSYEPPPPPPSSSGGVGSLFNNSNLMWGLGGALLGGFLGYMLGKNSAQQQQYSYPMPYWQQMPYAPAYGQVPGMRPPFMMPGMGGPFGGMPMAGGPFGGGMPYGGGPFGGGPFGGAPFGMPTMGGFPGYGGGFPGGYGGYPGMGGFGPPAILPYGGAPMMGGGFPGYGYGGMPGSYFPSGTPYPYSVGFGNASGMGYYNGGFYNGGAYYPGMTGPSGAPIILPYGR